MNEVAAVEETEIAATDAANTNETPQDSPQSVSLDREKNETAKSISQEQSTPHFGI
jgi:hypothetical protein